MSEDPLPPARPLAVLRRAVSIGAAALLLPVAQLAAQCESAILATPSELSDGSHALALAIDETTIAVGRPGNDFAGNVDAGALELYRRDDHRVWSREALWVPPAELADWTRFGERVALDVNGSSGRVATVARSRSDADLSWFAVLERSGTNWFPVQAWAQPYAATGHGSYGLALEGDWMAVGAPLFDAGTLVDLGAVEVLRRVNGTWVTAQVLFSPLPASGNEFGFDLAFSNGRLIVGAPGAGRAFVFEFAPVGTWLLAATLSDPSQGALRLGESVDLAGDDALLGSANSNVGVGARALHFRRSDAIWSAVEWLDAPGPFAAGADATIGSRYAALGLGAATAQGASGFRFFDRGAPAGAWIDRGVVAPTTPQLPGTLLGTVASTDDLLVAAARRYGNAEVRVYAFDHVGEPLWACPPIISYAAKGKQIYRVDAGPAHAFHLYWTLGTLTGTTPGFDFAGAHIPLNFDAYTELGLYSPNSAILWQNLGLLDGQGTAGSHYELLPTVGPWVIGAVAHHATVVIDPVTVEIELVTNAVRLEIVP